MADAGHLRAKASKCRELAEQADDRTASNLRMLADEYDEEAGRLEAKPMPRPAE